MNLKVTRLDHRITPDPTRVIARFFNPGGPERTRTIIERVLAMTAEEGARLLRRVEADFGRKHRDIAAIWRRHFEQVREHVPDGAVLEDGQALLIGAYFTMEYALESAALFNPSMVPSRDQNAVSEGSTRFTMSLRATGEGHISSIVYRRGLIDKDCNIIIEHAHPFGVPLKQIESSSCVKELWRQSPIAAGALSEPAANVLDRLSDCFTPGELHQAIADTRAELGLDGELEETQANLLAIAHGNYDLKVDSLDDISEVVIFPSSANESGGIEDLRLVRFTDDDDSVRYYGTYTAYNGFRIFPQLTEHDGGSVLKVRTLMGCGSQNKGMALFPRKIDGEYVMVSRYDNENLYLMRSDNILYWDEATLLQTPKFYWQIVQIGNCSSPLETEDGWLLLTHGVGPMRQYCIGASLLDLEDPTKVIGQTEEPLLVPTEEESSGYVPNVVYSCGGMIHNDMLIIPYAMSDAATSFAKVDLAELLATLKASR